MDYTVRFDVLTLTPTSVRLTYPGKGVKNIDDSLRHYGSLPQCAGPESSRPFRVPVTLPSPPRRGGPRTLLRTPFNCRHSWTRLGLVLVRYVVVTERDPLDPGFPQNCFVGLTFFGKRFVRTTCLDTTVVSSPCVYFTFPTRTLSVEV